MTNLEAKEKLYMEWQKLLEYSIDYAGISEAYKMAIKALEQEPCEDAISRQAVIEAFQIFREYESNRSNKEWVDRIETVLNQLPSVNPQPKTGHWIYRIYGEFHEEGNWHCSGCDYIFNGGYGHAEYCPKCGCKMSEAPTEEVKRI